ncbi:GDP-perosamine synthase [Alphaproteobacteria bacterium]|nr:GDP-perosamine synthase [Alphaproteobacteria bacterium]
MNFIPVNTPLFEGNEKKYLNECIDTGWISSEGNFVKKFEEDFAKYSQQQYGIAVSNGSVAIDLAIRAMKEHYNWHDNDEVIMPTFTIISCAQSIIYNKLKPIFVDCDPLTFNIDVNLIEQAITKKTKAIMVVHIYGLPSDMEPILNLAKKHNLKIIEDSAEVHGQEYQFPKTAIKKKCGSFGEVSTFSFYANKHITCGEGGMILTSDPKLAKKCQYLRNLCFGENRFVHEDLGWNFRMSNLQGAVGLAQFEQLEKFITKKKAIGKLYQELLKNIPALLPIESTPYADNHYWVFSIVLNDEVKFDAKYAMKILHDNGIGTRPFFYPMHIQPIIKKLALNDDVNRKTSEKIYQRGFYIPTGLGITQEQQLIVAKKIEELFK